MRLLVLGASSQLGRELTVLLGRREIEYTAFASSEIDLLEQAEVVKTLTREKPDQIINVASFTYLEKAETDARSARQCELINTRGVTALAEVCRRLSIPLIHHSSSYVFDGHKTAPYKEEDEPGPAGRYGRSKLLGEQAVRDNLEKHVIVRTDWLFSVHRNRFFKAHIEACRRNHCQTEVMDHRFSPTPADDAARVLLAIAQQVDCNADVWGTYHYCALPPLTEGQFVESFIREAAAYDPLLEECLSDLAVTVVPPVPPYVPNTVLSCRKIMETFGIKQRSRADAIRHVLEDLYAGHAGRAGDDAAAAAGAEGGRRKTSGRGKKAGPTKGSRPPARKAAKKKSSPSP